MGSILDLLEFVISCRHLCLLLELQLIADDGGEGEHGSLMLYLDTCMCELEY